jgi:TolB-like protein/tetratricopeptide (TPR) repeat protein
MARVSSFLMELRRRKVLRVTAIYAGATFAALEAVDVLTAPLRLPEWVLTGVLVAGVLGFPVAIVLSYLFQVTPEGIEPTKSSPEDDSVSRVTAVGVAGLALGLSLVTIWWVFASGSAVPETTVGPGDVAARLERSGPPTSLVILPFDVRSTDGEDASFFAEGLRDELSTGLGAVQGLRVLSPNSAQTYSATDDARSIGTALDVGAVLQGRVQQTAGQVQVSVRLVDTRDAQQIWASTYQSGVAVREVFDLQRDIAVEIVTALRSTLSPTLGASGAAAQTTDEEAYLFFLRGNRHKANATVREDAFAALAMYEQAVQRDPEFGAAWAALARTESMVFGLFEGTSERRDRALSALERAQALSPSTPDTRLAEGYVAFWIRLDFPAANEVFSTLRGSQANNDELHWAQGRLFHRLGAIDSAIVAHERALELNPGSSLYNLEVGALLYVQDRFSEAETYLDRAIAGAPTWLGGYIQKCVILTRMEGRTREIPGVLELAAGQVGVQSLLGSIATLPMRTLLPYSGVTLLDSLDLMTLDTTFIDPVSYHAAKAQLYRDRGSLDRARAHSDSVVSILEPLAEARPSEGRFQVELAYGYAGQGLNSKAIAAVQRALLLAPDSRDVATAGVWTLDLVLVLIMLGELDMAVDQLSHLHGRAFSPNAVAFEVHPWLTPIHDHPKFLTLMEDWDEARHRASPFP